MDSTTQDHLILETPENIRFGYDVADIGSRFLAILIDTLIQLALYFFLFVGIAILAPQIEVVDLPRPVSDGLVVAFILIIFLIQFGYFLFLEIIMNGQTPGKRLFRLRVVNESGYPLSPLGSIIRNIVRIIDFFPFAYGIGVITMFLNRRARRLGDFAAGTLVVKMRDEVKLSSILPAPGSPVSETERARSGVHMLSESEIALAESFLARSDNFTNQDTLGLQIAQRLAAKMQLTQPAIPTNAVDARKFLQDTVTAFRAPRTP